MFHIDVREQLTEKFSKMKRVILEEETFSIKKRFLFQNLSWSFQLCIFHVIFITFWKITFCNKKIDATFSYFCAADIWFMVDGIYFLRCSHKNFLFKKFGRQKLHDILFGKFYLQALWGSLTVCFTMHKCKNVPLVLTLRQTIIMVA